MPPPAIIYDLVTRFRANLDSYKRGVYNETQVRREFVDPFFEALGWDVVNRQGYAEAYKDVVHEDAIKISGGTKAPDYGFRIGGARKFFVEAKKPSVDLKNDVHPAYQLRRYAWSARLSLSILTDFEEFAVYDCRVKPDKADKPSAARVMYVTFEQYAERWDEIAGVFSREAILKGSFDRFAEARSSKRGTAEVDAAFLAEIERWRDLLAHNIALRNPALGPRELNFAVQQTIDRIIFLRIGEDRGSEPYGQLLSLVNGGQVYARLLEQFRRADDRYNSGLFHFRAEKDRLDAPDTLTPNLVIDDKVLRDILKNLYYPDSPYEFSVLPADILGQVYEQFLGKVIRLTSGHRAVVEEKPEVRKAGGVYYTPTYIVDYIVKQTIGKLVEDKRPGPLGGVSKLRILDPACGSGSFLLGAYQFLLDWHRSQYVADGPERWAGGRTPRLYQGRGGDWKLTIDERKRILLNNIFGVDIDPQAVEVTKLSLLLKVLEGEDEQTMSRQMTLFQARALPDLGRNIQCGNSLVGPDLYDGRQMALLSSEEALRVNVFDWTTAFPPVMADGGFDAVIGNPPYGAELQGFERSYLESKYELGTTDTAALMIAQALGLTRTGGLISFIVPKPLTFSSNWKKVRARLLDDLQELVDTGKVWKNVKLEQVIYVCRKGVSTKTYESCVRKDRAIYCLGEISKEECDRFGFFLNGVSDQEVSVAKKIQKVGVALGDLVTNSRGGMFQNSVNEQTGSMSR
ncbi:MAG: N-6 DNA methylase [Anaerolineae bacterium]